MEGLGNYFDRLIGLLPTAYGCLCPPIHLSYLQGIADTQKLKVNVITVNGEITRVFKSRTIDLYTPFLSNSGEAYITVLQDAVHFSEEADRNIRIPFLRMAIGLK
jgi:hypothetical protein